MPEAWLQICDALNWVGVAPWVNLWGHIYVYLWYETSHPNLWISRKNKRFLITHTEADFKTWIPSEWLTRRRRGFHGARPWTPRPGSWPRTRPDSGISGYSRPGTDRSASRPRWSDPWAGSLGRNTDRTTCKLKNRIYERKVWWMVMVQMGARRYNRKDKFRDIKSYVWEVLLWVYMYLFVYLQPWVSIVRNAIVHEPRPKLEERKYKHTSVRQDLARDWILGTWNVRQVSAPYRLPQGPVKTQYTQTHRYYTDILWAVTPTHGQHKIVWDLSCHVKATLSLSYLWLVVFL